MLKVNNILYILLSYLILYFVFCGCTSEKTNKDSLIQINISVSYPVKEIRLEDIADIEYLQFELDDDFLFQNAPHAVTSEKIITSYDGNILIFSRDGKPFSKFNRKGNGPGEYPSINQLLYDEASDEVLIRSFFSNKIMVYTTSGEFKRLIPLNSGTNPNNEIVVYNSELLLLYDDREVAPTRFSFISTEDGGVVETIDMPKDKKITVVLQLIDEKNVIIAREPAYHIVRHNNGYLLTDFSVDTVYFLSHNKELSPILVRKPKVQSMDPVVYLNSFIEAGNYEFMNSVKVTNENFRLPKTYLMRDKTTGKVYRQVITLNDYKGKAVTLSPETIANTQNSRLGFISLDLTELKDANRENKLTGALKELVDNSDDIGNDIYMLLHFK